MQKNPAGSAKEKSPRSGGLFLTITNIHTPRAARKPLDVKYRPLDGRFQPFVVSISTFSCELLWIMRSIVNNSWNK
jgi:hypothetical protein